MNVTEIAYRETEKAFGETDILGIEWRVKFALKAGFSEKEAFDFALLYSGMKTTNKKVYSIKEAVR